MASASGTYLSPSAAATWRQCPRRWWFKYVEQLPEPPPGEPAVLGSFVHLVLEHLLELEPGERTPEQARLLATTLFNDDLVRRGDWRALGHDDAGVLRFKQKAWTTLEAFFAAFPPAVVQPVHQELRLSLEIDGVPFRGFVDLVERDADVDATADGTPAIVVTDYKTGKPPEAGTPWADEQNAEKLLQPLWYAAALAEMGQYRPTRARLLYFTAIEDAAGSLQARTGTLSAEVDDETLARARAELVRRWQEITDARAAGAAPSNPGPLCGWCPFVAHCEEGTSECTRRWGATSRDGGRRLRADAPAVAMLGLT
jgi:putative RecB family exonuclease